MKQQILTQLSRYGLASLFGALGGLITVLTVVLLDLGIHEVWETIFGIDTSAPTRTTGVFITMGIATLLISYIVFRYGKANASLDELIHEILNNGEVKWRKLPKALLIAFPSLISGASLGPEAPAAIASIGATGAIAEKSNIAKKDLQAINTAAFSGMLGSILSSPFLAPAMIVETAKKKVEDLQSLLTTSLVASAFGTATFFVVFGKIYTFDLPTEGYTGSGYIELFYAFLLGIAGCVFAAIVAKSMQFFSKLFSSIAKTDVQLILLTGLVISILMYAFPLTMFSGQHTLDDLYTYSLSAGFVSLLAIAFVKMLSAALLIRAGFIGGGIFPALFTGAAFGLALNQLFNVSPMVAAVATTVGLLTAMMRQPLSAAILTILVFGFATGAIVASAVAGALLVLSLLPKKQ